MDGTLVKSELFREGLSCIKSNLQGCISVKKDSLKREKGGEWEEAKSGKMKRWKGRQGGERCTLKTLRRENYSGREQGLWGSARGKNKGRAWGIGKPSANKTLDKCLRQDRKSQTP